MAKKIDKELTFLEKPWQEYESVKYWLGKLRTKRNLDKCIFEFPKFLKEVKLDPDTILEQRRSDLQSKDMKERARWEDIVSRWYHKEYERFVKDGKSAWTPWTTIGVVRSFFSHHRYALHYGAKELRKPTSKIKDYVPCNEEIRAMYSLTETWRDKSLLLALAQTGLSEIDVSNLNVEEFNEKWNEEFIYFEGYRSKTEIKVQTCFGPDWKNATLKMLALRGNPTNGPLYSQSVGPKAGERMSVNAIREAIKKLFAKAEIKTGDERFYVKNLRDTFSDALDQAGVKEKISDRMMGWKLAGAKSHYKISKTTIINAYLKAWKYLTIDEYTAKREGDRDVKGLTDANTKMLEILMSSKNLEEAKKKYRDWLGVSMDYIGPLTPRMGIERALEESA